MTARVTQDPDVNKTGLWESWSRLGNEVYFKKKKMFKIKGLAVIALSLSA